MQAKKTRAPQRCQRMPRERVQCLVQFSYRRWDVVLGRLDTDVKYSTREVMIVQMIQIHDN